MTRFLKALWPQLVILVGVFALTFAMMRSMGGDAALTQLGVKGDAETVARLRKEMGLDAPLPVQFVRDFKRIFLQADLGESYRTHHPVLRDVSEALPATVELSSLAMLLALGLGVPLGILSARHRGSWLDLGLTQLSLTGVSVPVFLLGFLLILVFKDVLWLSFNGRVGDFVEVPAGRDFLFWGSLLRGDWPVFKDALSHIVLPAVTLATIPMALIMRLTRSTFLDILGEDFMRTARAKGLNEWRVTFKHGLKVAATPIVTVVGLQVGMLMSGAVLTETIFSWPGMGSYLINSIEAKDYPAIQGCILIFAVIFIVINMLVDLSYSWLDPRVSRA